MVIKLKLKIIESGEEPDGTSGILRITQDGKPVVSSVSGGDGGILGNTYPLNLYYAYGIRNSFGMDFDPDKQKSMGYRNWPNLWRRG